MKKILSFLLLLMPLSLMAEEATITLMANGKVYKEVKTEVGKTIGDVYNDFDMPDAYPFRIYDGIWAKNATGDPKELPSDEVIKGDMTLYYHWIIYKGVTKKYLKRIKSREEVEDYTTFYLVTADGKHAMVSDSEKDWYHMSINENSYSINGLAMKFGTQKDVNIQGDSIDIVDGDNPLTGVLPYYFFERYGDEQYTALGNGIPTYGDNFAYQQGDGEPYFGHLSNRGRDDLGKAGYNFVWNISFTADGYAKLENENFGYIYYDETANEDGHNFRLSKTATPNLVAYKYVEEFGYKFTTSLDYYTVTLNKNIPEGANCYIMPGTAMEEASTAVEFYEEQTETSSKFAVMKGYKLPFFIDYYDSNMYKHEWSFSGEGTGKEEPYEMHGEERDAYVVTPTGECTVNFSLTEALKVVTVGNTEVKYSPEGQTDVYNDGTVVVTGSTIALNNANVENGVVSDMTGLEIVFKSNSNIKGGVIVLDDLIFNSWETIVPKVTIDDAISSKSNSNYDFLRINSIEIDARLGDRPSKAKAPSVGGSVSSVISGFAGMYYDEENYVMALPKDGYYNTITRMLCNSDGTPAQEFMLLTKEHYNEYISGVNTVQGEASATTRKVLSNGQLIIEKSGNRYNSAGQLLK